MAATPDRPTPMGGRIRIFSTRLHRSHLRAHWLTATVILVGLGLTVAFAWTSHSRTMERSEDLMDSQALFVSEAIRVAVRASMDATAAGAGLFVASAEVTEAEFERFVGSVGHPPGAIGLAYVPSVDPDHWESYLEATIAVRPDYELFRLDQDGTPATDPDGTSRYPVRYFARPGSSNLELRGFDAASDAAWIEAIEQARSRQTTAMSRLTQLFGSPGDWGYVAAAPVAESDRISGFVVAVVRLDMMVEPDLSDSLTRVVNWSVRDVTGDTTLLVSPDRLRKSQTLEVGGRQWLVEVVPTESARNDLVGSGLWADIAFGLLVTVLLTIISHLAVGAVRTRRETATIQGLADEKDEFLAAISHELRTPLTVIVGMASILEDSTRESDAEIQEYVSLLHQEGNHLARLVDDLLLMGRLDAQVLPMRPERIDVRWEVERIVTEIDRPTNVDLSIIGEGEAWADPLRLRHVLRHLYTNALRHGGNDVTLRIESDSHEVRVCVCDNGRGVAADRLPRLFHSSSGTKETPGGPSTLGLGLRVSKRLAQALGGDLAYRRVDCQTVFELRLPRSDTPIGGIPSSGSNNSRAPSQRRSRDS